MSILKYVQQDAISNLIPPWACDRGAFAEVLERGISGLQKENPLALSDVTAKIPFWVEVDVRHPSNGSFRLVVPDGGKIDNSGRVLMDATSPEGERVRIEVPLNPMLSDYPRDPARRFSLYIHQFSHGGAPRYIGITGRSWWERLAEHQASARRGSRLMFHRALYETGETLKVHQVALSHAPYESVMAYEEELVRDVSLYPLGLNMIPGGFAGLKYLSSLGFSARTVIERDIAIERLLRMDTIKGRANPLCAARWVNDQEFINRIICGHGNRLSVQQVRVIRMLSDSGYDEVEIQSQTGATTNQISGVISDRVYSRVA